MSLMQQEAVGHFVTFGPFPENESHKIGCRSARLEAPDISATEPATI